MRGDSFSVSIENLPDSPMGSRKKKMKIRKVFDKMTEWVTPWRSNFESPRERMIMRGDVEQDEFQYASSHCLSSYYSVFVARLAIMVMLAILIGLLTVLTWHFTRVYTKQSLQTLAYGLRYELLQRPVLRMWSVLNTTSELTTAQVKLSEYVIKKYDKPTTQEELVEMYQAMKDVTWALFASAKALNAITINYRNGFVQAFHRDPASSSTFYIFSDLKNYSISGTGPGDVSGWNNQSIHGNMSAIWYQQQLDPITGEKLGKPLKIPPDDLINIAGISQVPDGEASWHVTVSKYMDSPLLSAALPVFDASNKSIVAVVGVTTALYSVGQLMRDLVEVHGGHIYLTSQEGYLLATSTNGPLLTNTSNGPKLMKATDSEEWAIKAGAQWLEKTYGSNRPHVVHAENVKLGDQQYYIDSFYLNLKRLPIVGVVIIPRKFIMGKVDERAFKTLVILISASVCIFIIGCVCILILTNGVSKEMKLRAELIRQLDARRRAEASSNYKSQFLANMSHELRTPMAAVIGLLDILISDDCLSNEQYATVTQIRKCSTALLRLLNNILDLSKVESGKLVLEEAEFDLGRELEGLVDMFSVQCINHNVETVLDLSDDMPALVRGDSARLVQIFANLISNSIKFTTTGHIILRGWCENMNSLHDEMSLTVDRKKPWAPMKTKMVQHRSHFQKSFKNTNKMVLWFEVDDTGCGIDPSKWDSVFESFEQADPSTTRTHGGTGLGLCIVRNLVNKMGGEIKVVQKNGLGTLMRLYLILSIPDTADQNIQPDFSKYGLVVLLSMYGSTARMITSKWLRKHGIATVEASDWNELTHIIRDLFETGSGDKSFDSQHNIADPLRAEPSNIKEIENPVFVIVVDIGVLDLTTDIWKEQLNYLDRFSSKAKFAWLLKHDTSNTVKTELRRKGHVMMVNKPLYKAKMIQILEAVIKNRKRSLSSGLRNRGNISDESHDCLEIDPTQFDTCSSDDSSETSGEKQVDKSVKPSTLQSPVLKNYLIDATNSKGDSTSASMTQKNPEEEDWKDRLYSGIALDGKNLKSLEGIRILLAEDTPVLQRVATIMLEKMGATVTAVGDGQQAVDSLNYRSINAQAPTEEHKSSEEETAPWSSLRHSSPYDLILMDCQMPKVDGYEATKAIRKAEIGTELHIPIVALTAHAMSSDEAKCLEVGMDAYLTKPIDRKLMVSTILSLTKPSLSQTSSSS
ncbi:PREDICTED: histidine kinase 1-like isoform X2 [Camelina sativa]|uniref:histidine kinase n=1 Tax=Camelina sativa TaxID=90675 RepID=A0ABM1QZ78_CAMSA|nr:PREDICTED: histidine kinase 1-like isoform X1 [Camelina sativa]XP_019092066.1 PREDICTED: histidine kinase 1-like isoform X2 [Camelina sativa]